MTLTQLTIKGRPPVLGTFSKGTAGSVSINFGTSGGANCWEGCVWLGNGCYAQSIETRPDRQNLAAKLQRHEVTRPDWILSRGIAELEARPEPPPWVRTCTNGSLPPRITAAMSRQWRRFGDYIIDHDLRERHHIPAESPQKASAYRAIDRRLTIRESTQTWERWIRARGAVSFVASGPGIPLLRRIDDARRAAAARREATGRPTGVCPAVMQTFRQRLWLNGKQGAQRRGQEWAQPMPQSAKCGQCRLCALPGFDVVYPYHK